MSTKKQSEEYTTKEKAAKHDMLSPMLDGIYNEAKELSKKKQADVLNELKVKMINRILQQIKELLAEEPTADFIDLLDNETLPTNSDAVLILAQFRSAMAQFENSYYRNKPGSFGIKMWMIK